MRDEPPCQGPSALRCRALLRMTGRAAKRERRDAGLDSVRSARAITDRPYRSKPGLACSRRIGENPGLLREIAPILGQSPKIAIWALTPPFCLAKIAKIKNHAERM